MFIVPFLLVFLEGKYKTAAARKVMWKGFDEKEK